MTRKTFSRSVREEIYERENYRCYNCGDNQRLSIHHIVENKKVNALIYGHKLIQSAENGVLCCLVCHTDHSSWDKNLKSALLKKWNNKSKSKVK